MVFFTESLEYYRYKMVKDLHKIPFTKKTDLRDNYPYRMYVKPMEEIKKAIELFLNISTIESDI